MQTKPPSFTEGSAVTFSVRLWKGQRELIEAGASAKQKTLPDYIISSLIPIAAKDAGVPVPAFREFPRRPRNNRQAEEDQALRMGMSRKEYREWAVREITERLRGQQIEPPTPPTKPKKKR